MILMLSKILCEAIALTDLLLLKPAGKMGLSCSDAEQKFFSLQISSTFCGLFLFPKMQKGTCDIDVIYAN